jgi:L-fuconolactonase
MFGSDWPVCTLSAPFKKWVETLSILTQGASEEQRNNLFRQNATRIYKLEKLANRL